MPFLRPNRNTSPFPNYSYLFYNIPHKEDKGKSGIYVIINNINNNLYIGSSVNLLNRWRTHRCDLRKGIHKNEHLQNSWNKYGESNFLFGILEFVSKEKLIEREQFFLDGGISGFNICRKAGSTVGYRHTEETRDRMRRNHADFSGNKNPMYGVKFEGEKNHMFGKKRPDTSDFNKRTKKGRTWEEMYGEERAKKMKEELALKMKGNIYSKKPVN